MRQGVQFASTVIRGEAKGEITSRQPRGAFTQKTKPQHPTARQRRTQQQDAGPGDPGRDLCPGTGTAQEQNKGKDQRNSGQGQQKQWNLEAALE
ncbi:MAG TPA: hypothetical protein VH105_19790 [Burkholderiales bacterium]|nr:hypothetical protein [Burkholderiales bacterium]